MPPENRKRALQGALLSKNSTLITNYKPEENQEMLWAKFQQRAELSQRIPSQENIVAANSAHAQWAEVFLNKGGSYV